MDTRGHDDYKAEGIVGTPDGTEKTLRPQFYTLCIGYALYSDELLALAEQAGVPFEVVEAMFVGDPVKRAFAVAVLKAFSQQVGDSWTLDNTRVPTLPESEDRP